MELGSTDDNHRGIISTKEEMLKSLKSWFEHVHSDNNCVIATLLDPRLKATFYDATATKSAVQTLVELCENCEDLDEQDQMSKDYKNTQGVQQDEQASRELVDCVDSAEPSSIETPESATTITTSEEKKGFSIWDSYKKAVKKLTKPSSVHTLSWREKISAMANDYVNEPVTENPKYKKSLILWNIGIIIENIILF